MVKFDGRLLGGLEPIRKSPSMACLERTSAWRASGRSLGRLNKSHGWYLSALSVEEPLTQVIFCGAVGHAFLTRLRLAEIVIGPHLPVI